MERIKPIKNALTFLAKDDALNFYKQFAKNEEGKNGYNLPNEQKYTFEEINPEKLNLITIVGDVKGIDSLSDEKIQEINDNLLIKSFDEFLEKFSPSVYSFYNAANQKVAYTLKKPENMSEECISEIRLDQNNDFLKMLFTLIDTKRSQGIKNVDFKFEKVIDMISPKKIVEDIRQVRKEIHYLYNKYDELYKEDPKKLELGDKLNYKFEEASQNYNNVMAMLPLAIEDIKTRLLFGRSQEDTQAEAIQIGMLTMGENGELKILEAPKSDSNALMVMDEDRSNSLVGVFEEDYSAITESPSDYVKDLVVRTFCPLPAVQEEIDVEREVQNYNTYLEFYKSAKDDFVKTAKPLVEKILGVKMFLRMREKENICNPRVFTAGILFGNIETGQVFRYIQLGSYIILLFMW